MTHMEYSQKAQELETAGVHDEENPYYALQALHTKILQMAAKGEIDLNELARMELENRRGKL